MTRRARSVLAVLAVLALPSSATAATLTAPFADDYELVELGAPPGVPLNLAGVTVKMGENNTLLFAGDAEEDTGAVYQIAVVRDADGHITGYGGSATKLADAQDLSGGLDYGPGGVLFHSRWPNNDIGQTKPGSAITDRVVDLDALGVVSSVDSLVFVPAGFPGAGSLKFLTFGAGGQFYDATVTADANGTFDIGSITQQASLPNSVGLAYVPSGLPEFPAQALLVNEYSAGRVAVYDLDSDGDPVTAPVSTRRELLSGFSTVMGAEVDPVTSDFLLTSFGSDVLLVKAVEEAPPPPGAAPVAATGAAAAAAKDAVTFTGTVNPRGVTTHYYFEYGKTTAYGSATPVRSAGAGTQPVQVSERVSGLEPGTTYHYRLRAANSRGAIVGEDRTVTTQRAERKRLADLPPPVIGRLVNAEPASGRVYVAVAGGRATAAARRGRAAQVPPPPAGLKGFKFVPLEEARQIPIGSLFDTRRGTVRIQTASGRPRRTQQGSFLGGVFQTLQTRTGKAKGLTELRLKGSSFKTCGPTGRGAIAHAATKRRIRRLRANAKGRFRTRGRYSAATVRGTIWTITDRCDGTLTSVKRGTVTVRDFRRRKNITLRAGKSYLAPVKR